MPDIGITAKFKLMCAAILFGSHQSLSKNIWEKYKLFVPVSRVINGNTDQYQIRHFDQQMTDGKNFLENSEMAIAIRKLIW